MFLTVPQVNHYAQGAGFTGQSLAVIVAIAGAETGGTYDTHATNTHTSVGVDRGILQINSYFWPGCSDTCAYDPGCDFEYAFHIISNGGSDFSKWVTYTSGAYKRYYNTTIVTDPIPFNTSTGQKKPSPYPLYAGHPWYSEAFLAPFRGTRFVHSGGDTGDDIATPLDTPMTALLPGTITTIEGGPPGGTHASGLSTYGYGWEVSWALDKPWMGAHYEYVIHLDAVNPYLKVGQHIDAGTLLGWSGGARYASEVGNASNPLGVHTFDSPANSGGIHTEVGFFRTLNDFANADTPDPTPAIVAAQRMGLEYGTGDVYGTGGSAQQYDYGGSMQQFSVLEQRNVNVLNQGFPFWPFGGNTPDYDAFSQAIHKTLVQYPGFYGICLALDEAEQFPGLYQSYGPQDVLPWNLTQDTWRSIVGTAVGNTMPLAIRGTLIVFGLFLLLALFWQLVKPSIEVLPELIGAAA